MEQTRVPIAELVTFIQEKICFNNFYLEVSLMVRFIIFLISTPLQMEFSKSNIKVVRKIELTKRQETYHSDCEG